MRLINSVGLGTTIVVWLNIGLLAGIGYLFWLVVKALRTYIRKNGKPDPAAPVRRSLGEAIKAHRIRCGMSQELLAERLGVSRQAVSKWETGAAEPSTSNLLALAKAFDIPSEQLLREIQM